MRLEASLDYVPGSIVSRTLARAPGGLIILFAFDKGQELSEHTTSCDAVVQILDGVAELTIGGAPVTASAGETVLMPANVPHALRAPQRFKMLLSMVKA